MVQGNEGSLSVQVMSEFSAAAARCAGGGWGWSRHHVFPCICLCRPLHRCVNMLAASVACAVVPAAPSWSAGRSRRQHRLPALHQLMEVAANQDVSPGEPPSTSYASPRWRRQQRCCRPLPQRALLRSCPCPQKPTRRLRGRPTCWGSGCGSGWRRQAARCTQRCGSPCRPPMAAGCVCSALSVSAGCCTASVLPELGHAVLLLVAQCCAPRHPAPMPLTLQGSDHR